MDFQQEVGDLLERVWLKLQALPTASGIELAAFLIIIVFMLVFLALLTVACAQCCCCGGPRRHRNQP